MSRKIILSLPVENLDASKAFFLALGFSINAQFSDALSALMVVSEEISLMLLTREKFREFAPPGNEIVSGTRATEVLISLSLDSKEEVDSLAEAALSAGASSFEEAQDHGFMYARSFQDPDGHGWQVMWMDPGSVPPVESKGS